MYRVLSIVVLLTTIARAASALCTGTDMRASFTEAERMAAAARQAAIPYATGNHWRAQRGAQVFNIIGTLHVDDPRLDALGDGLAPLVRMADRVFVEATRDGLAKLQNMLSQKPERVFMTEGPTLIDLLPDNQWQQVATAAQERGIPPFIAAKFQPWYLTLNLSMPSCVLADARKGARGLDFRLIEIAENAQVPLLPLEPYDMLFQLFGAAPLDTQLTYLTAGVLPDTVATDATVTFLEAYFAEQTGQLLDLPRTIGARFLDLPPAELERVLQAQFSLLLDARNQNWLEVLTNAPKGLSVVAVGAAHLPGENGILNLLAGAGFTIDRQPFPVP